MTLVPAYGCDYASKKALLVDWNGNKDFQICDMFSAGNGRYVTLAELTASGFHGHLTIRYKRLTQVYATKL